MRTISVDDLKRGAQHPQEGQQGVEDAHQQDGINDHPAERQASALAQLGSLFLAWTNVWFFPG